MRYKTTNWERLEMFAPKRKIRCSRRDLYLKALKKVLKESGEAVKLTDLVKMVNPKLTTLERQREYTYARTLLRGVYVYDPYKLVKVNGTVYVVRR